ncbi:MAG: ATP-binding protein [Actinomycetota bacterium]|nr:ATP-binding protein [Actinomycetota bacterium]
MTLGRNAVEPVSELLSAFRLVVLGGARQTGKTTLIRELLGLNQSSRFSLDDPSVLGRAVEDPAGFVEALPRPAAIDEFQRAGSGLLLAVKQAADLDSSRGQLLLTGSANYLADRSVSETLAGRAGRLVLWPLSVGERLGLRETFVDHLLSAEGWPPPASTPLSRAELVDLILSGGYPEVVTQGLRGRHRRAWFDAYTHDVVSREALRPIADVRLENELRTVLRLLAARTAGELITSGIAQGAELNRATAANYVGLLQALYLVVTVPAWSNNPTTRVTRRSKVILIDSGLAADLTGAGEADFGAHADGRTAGALFETFVVTEICKQAGWSENTVDIHHFRDRNGDEIDLIVSDRRSGRFAGIEIKLTSTPLARHARTLASFRDTYGPRFTVGLVVHTGSHTLPLGDRLWAVPVGTLWRTDPAVL